MGPDTPLTLGPAFSPERGLLVSESTRWNAHMQHNGPSQVLTRELALPVSQEPVEVVLAALVEGQLV